MTIAPGKIVTQDRDLYRVDGFLMDGTAIPPDTDVPFELEMQCFKLRAWQQVVHADDSDCVPAPPPPRPPLLGKPRPPIVNPYECGAVYCYPQEQTTLDPSKVYNFRGDEWCENPLIPKVTYEAQSTNDYENAGVYIDLC